MATAMQTGTRGKLTAEQAGAVRAYLSAEGWDVEGFYFEDEADQVAAGEAWERVVAVLGEARVAGLRAALTAGWRPAGWKVPRARW